MVSYYISGSRKDGILFFYSDNEQYSLLSRNQSHGNLNL